MVSLEPQIAIIYIYAMISLQPGAAQFRYNYKIIALM